MRHCHHHAVGSLRGPACFDRADIDDCSIGIPDGDCYGKTNIDRNAYCSTTYYLATNGYSNHKPHACTNTDR